MCVRAAILLLVLLTTPSIAWAKLAGFAGTGCGGCHGSSDDAVTGVQVGPAQPAVNPGGSIVLTLTFPAASGRVGGFHALLRGAGTLAAVNAEAKTSGSANSIVHSSPKASSGGIVSFQVRYTAPASSQGGADIEFWILSGNNNGGSSGDLAGYTRASVVWGCGGTTYYADNDGDGFGVKNGGPGSLTRNCSQPPGYSTNADDCEDSDEKVHPSATEVCNNRDDNCSGTADEGLSSQATTFYPDADGDGFGVPGASMPGTGCQAPSGYAPNATDCVDSDAQIHPGRTETCNGKDDDCDGRTDEGVTPTCGEGMCRRAAPACRLDLCVPGEPVAETCNALDDDCDGEVDEDAQLCGSGKICSRGECVEGGSSSQPGGKVDAGAGDGDTGGGPTGSGSGGGCSATGSGLGLGVLLWVGGWLGRVLRTLEHRRAIRAPSKV